MSPHQSRPRASVIVPLSALSLMTCDMEQSYHCYPTEDHAGPVGKSPASCAEGLQLEEWDL